MACIINTTLKHTIVTRGTVTLKLGCSEPHPYPNSKSSVVRSCLTAIFITISVSSDAKQVRTA